MAEKVVSRLRPPIAEKHPSRVESAVLGALLFLLGGCMAFPPEGARPDPPLRPIEGPGAGISPGQEGQERASFQMTEEGRGHLNAGRIEEAASLFQKAISLFPKNPYAYYYLGRSRYLGQDYARALPALDRAELFLSRDPAWLSKVSTLRGQVFEALSRRTEALAQYRRALGLDPRNREAEEGIRRLDAPVSPSAPDRF